MRKIKDLALYSDGGHNWFPSIVRARDGSYLLAFRHNNTNSHLDFDSVTYVVKSTDGCETWSGPRMIRFQEGQGNQDPVLNVLRDGTVLMTVFVWRREDGGHRYNSYAYASRDNGGSWEGPNLIAEDLAIRGRCAQLPGGTILAPLYGGGPSVICASRDGGVSWTPYSSINGLPDQDEPTLLRTRSGKIFCFIRTREEMYYCSSDDDGRAFGMPVATGLPGSVPYDALQLPSGNVYLAYGHRKEPFGIRALLLDGGCGGMAKDREFILRDDGLDSDISYVSSAMLPGGDILTAYYYRTEESGHRRFIAGTAVREE